MNTTSQRVEVDDAQSDLWAWFYPVEGNNTFRAQFRWGLALGLCLLPIEVCCLAIAVYRVSQSVWNSELFILGGFMALAAIVIPLMVEVFFAKQIEVVLDRSKNTGIVCGRSFELDDIDQLLLQEVVQTGPKNGEDIFPRRAWRLLIELNGDRTICVGDSLHWMPIQTFAERMAEFLNVDLQKHGEFPLNRRWSYRSHEDIKPLQDRVITLDDA